MSTTIVESNLGRDDAPATLFVTGATGFLGRTLLAELAKRPNVIVWCLIRADSDDEASARRQQITDAPNVRAIRGDVSEDQLGLSRPLWKALVETVNEIYHVAANVRFDQPLAEARAINVAGTRNVLALAVEARTHRLTRLHHVSTAYVAGRTSGTSYATKLPAIRPWNFNNSYERTKAEAEHLLRSQGIVPVSIYRPSIIAGHSVDGATDNWTAAYYPMKMVVSGVPLVFPERPGALLDVVAVDFVAKAIARRAVRDDDDALHCYHLTQGTDAFTLRGFARQVERIGSAAHPNRPMGIRHVHPLVYSVFGLAVWAAAAAPRRFQRVSRWGRLRRRVLRGFAPYAPYVQWQTVFDNTAETHLLACDEIMMPPSHRYGSRIISFAVASDFGRRVAEDETVETLASMATTDRQAVAP